MIEHLTIDPGRFNNAAFIKSRLASADAQDAVRTALRFLYFDDGPFNLPDDQRKAAEPYLEPAERLLVGWLAIRTKGLLGNSDGKAEMTAARSARYRCQACGFPDVRVLNLDEVDGSLECLCANCHVIRTRWQRRR